MQYRVYEITQSDAPSAITELFYNIACSRQKKEELLCFFFVMDDEKARKKVMQECIKVLKKLKKENKITLFLSYENFSDNSTQTKYLFNKYPEIEEDKELLNPSRPYILVRL